MVIYLRTYILPFIKLNSFITSSLTKFRFLACGVYRVSYQEFLLCSSLWHFIQLNHNATILGFVVS
ncbi:hypothetical protein [Malacoplasma penetrans HF-2]|uniref:Uncharacterized protein n=1 Tax=Malacoplasma penetrans (strain HF-2) TaxID=272633 RepID=Q8EW08_MALP2|nr:hypothetical protein [Malacoplasma penetrans HF-2]